MLDHSMRLFVSEEQGVGNREQGVEDRGKGGLASRDNPPFVIRPQRMGHPVYLAVVVLWGHPVFVCYPYSLLPIPYSLLPASPGGVGGAIDAGLLGAAVDVVDAGFGLIEGRQGVLLGGHPGVGAVGKGVGGHDFDVAGLDEVVEGLGGLLFVDGVGVDGLAHDVEVFFKYGLLGSLDVGDVSGDGDGCQETDDDHDDHELEQSKA